MLDFLTRDFPLYAWSLRMLDRRLRHFDIFFNDSAVKVDHVMKAFETEPNGPGKLLEYHAMHKKNKAIALQVVPDGIPDHIDNFPEQ